jgi:hypothetical protein
MKKTLLFYFYASLYFTKVFTIAGFCVGNKNRIRPVNKPINRGFNVFITA